jgi:hypothetical protein
MAKSLKALNEDLAAAKSLLASMRYLGTSTYGEKVAVEGRILQLERQIERATLKAAQKAARP